MPASTSLMAIGRCGSTARTVGPASAQLIEKLCATPARTGSIPRPTTPPGSRPWWPPPERRRPESLGRRGTGAVARLCRLCPGPCIARRSAGMAYVDPAVRMPPNRRHTVSPSRWPNMPPRMDAALQNAQRMNPIYLALRQAWATARARDPSSPNTALLRINMERARALPPDLGQRYILVNPAAEHLWMYSGGERQAQMRVVVGKLTEPTPPLTGLIRYALFNPYWNVPPDLVRDKIAPKVLGHGLGLFPGTSGSRRWTARRRTPPCSIPATIDWNGRRVRGRRKRCPGAAAAWAAQHDGQGEVHAAQSARHLSARHPHARPVRRRLAHRQRRLQFMPAASAQTRWRGCWGKKQAFDEQGRAGPAGESLPQPVPVYVLYLTAHAPRRRAGEAMSCRISTAATRA